MTVAVMEAERTVNTGNIVLDMEIPLLSDKQLEKLADYVKYLRWSSEDDDDWADAPLTPEEEAQREESIRDFENGEYLTVDEIMRL